ncbi:hypothetical protein ABID47_002465 [Paenibacillus favisporus]|uniref:Iron transporter n=1 Tax=Paenibacillus favisporus TaxID=221028 RepID=A0ABV2F262_9BACL
MMTVERHEEKHFNAPDLIRDIVIGMSDGLTVPFALAAGLSGTVPNTSLVVVAGMAEIAAGAIAMGLGGYLAARTDQEHYASELVREQEEIQGNTGSGKGGSGRYPERVAFSRRNCGIGGGCHLPGLGPMGSIYDEI